MSCPGCNAAMSLVPCSSSKSPDGLIWRRSPCKKYKNIRTDSVLSGQKIALKTFIQLLFCLSIKGLTGIAVSQMTGLSENTVSDWKIYLHTRLSDWLLANPSPLGGPGVIVEVDEAKFGKRKYKVQFTLSQTVPLLLCLTLSWTFPLWSYPTLLPKISSNEYRPKTIPWL